MRAAHLFAVVLAGCGAGAASPKSPTAPVTAAPSPPAPAPSKVTWQQLHGPILSVTLTGGSPADNTRVQPILDKLIGQPIDRAQLRRAFDIAMSTQTLADLDASGEQLADGVKLVVALRAQPVVRDVTIREAAGKPVAIPAVTAAKGAPLDPIAIESALGELRDGYLSAGNLAFTARWHTTKAADNAVDIIVDVELGDAIMISAHTFHGNTHTKSADLEHALGQELQVGTPWMADHVDRAMLLLMAYFYDHGYVNAEVTPPKPPAHGPAPVVFEIREGDLFHYGKIEFTGIPAADAKKLLPILKLKTGDVFGRTAVVDAMDRVRHSMKDHPHAAITPETDVDTKKHTIALKLAVTLDPPPPAH